MREALISTGLVLGIMLAVYCGTEMMSDLIARKVNI